VPFVSLITGASSGIGAAAARRLAREPDARLVLVARREDRLRALASELGGATAVAVDLVEDGAPRRVREAVEREHGELHLLVNNAGGSWRGEFADVGWENVERHMKLNFEAPVRLTGELLPLLRATAAARRDGGPRVSVVNVASTAGRVSRPGSGAYSASKFALAGWSDALYAEERPRGVHVGLVLPGFVKTEGFPARELEASPLTRWIVSKPEVVAEAIVEAGPGGRPERYVPRGYWLAAAARILAPALVRRVTAGGALSTSTPATEQEAAARAGDTAEDRGTPSAPAAEDRGTPSAPAPEDRGTPSAPAAH
jgi:short-subunit dehydrogenase